jgi:hypothetical protein
MANVRGAIAFVLVTLVFAIPSVVRGKEHGKAGTDKDKAERGKYLVTFGGCNDCHTPWIMTEKGPAPDPKRTLSGHPADIEVPPPPVGEGPWNWHGLASNTGFSGPWGKSFADNLTPDNETGIGEWTAKEFIQTLRSGRHRGKGAPLLPPMPWFNYANASDADLEAIFAYLKSLPPIRNKVPDSAPAAPPGPRAR